MRKLLKSTCLLGNHGIQVNHPFLRLPLNSGQLDRRTLPVDNGFTNVRSEPLQHLLNCFLKINGLRINHGSVPPHKFVKNDTKFLPSIPDARIVSVDTLAKDTKFPSYYFSGIKK